MPHDVRHGHDFFQAALVEEDLDGFKVGIPVLSDVVLLQEELKLVGLRVNQEHVHY